MDYNHFTVKDFVRDPYFQKWILSDDAKVASFWKTWLEQHPHKAEEVAKARETIRLLSFQRSYQTNEDFLEVWESVEQKIGDEVSVRRRASLKPLLRAAAVLIGLLITTALVLTLWENNPTVTYATQFGETRSVSLPDGSEVTINANSSIRFSEDWDQNSTREVWLNGEAFFEVKKVLVGTANQTDSSLPVKFIVHTGALDVEVIGTQFNVNTRREETKVVLQSGKVKLNVKDKDGENVEEVFMQPGDMVAFNKVSKAITKQVVNPDVHSSWVDHKLIFEEALLKDIAQTMEDMYGVNVVFKDPKLAEEQFTGVLPSNDVNALLEAFTKVYGIRVTNDKNSITFHPLIESE